MPQGAHQPPAAAANPVGRTFLHARAEHALFARFLATLGYPHVDDSAHPAYRLLLRT